MASELPNTYESPSVYDFEGLEVTEFDEDTLRELLEEEEPEQNLQDNFCDGIIGSMELANGDSPNMTLEYSDKIQPHCDDFPWIDTMEIDPALPSSDTDFWYMDAHTEQLIHGTAEIRDAVDSNTVQIDDLTYFGLWKDN
ncbi:hypothetical protein ACH5RR_036983 [Cinchona calisaya]|uniref:Uncharacterized protein n=1 Tax=Cinchona calisaya TaxID=153742 RepID=A0ABD2Y992_9GENT